MAAERVCGDCDGCSGMKTVLDAFQVFMISYMDREGVSEIRVSPKDTLQQNLNTAVKFEFFPDRQTGELVCRMTLEECPACSHREGMH